MASLTRRKTQRDISTHKKILNKGCSCLRHHFHHHHDTSITHLLTIQNGDNMITMSLYLRTTPTSPEGWNSKFCQLIYSTSSNTEKKNELTKSSNGSCHLKKCDINRTTYVHQCWLLLLCRHGEKVEKFWAIGGAEKHFILYLSNGKS